MSMYTPDPKRQGYGAQTCCQCGQTKSSHHANGVCFRDDELLQRLAVFQRSPNDQRLMARMLYTLQTAYRKHALDDPRIGWEELSDLLLTTLCEVMGDRPFQAWLASQKDTP